MRTIKNIHRAVSDPIADLTTYRAMPTHSVNHLDPFLFLNHHGPQVYGKNNNGLPFGPHPHRGFETLTFILDGDLMHKDSGGYESIINEGGIQWMTAGRGLVHAEVSSKDFLTNGGNLEIIQLWLNLPASLKMMDPTYKGLQKDHIPIAETGEGKVKLYVVSGTFNDVNGPVDPVTDISICRLEMKSGGKYNATVPKDKNILLYVVNGLVEVNGKEAGTHNLVEFDLDGDQIEITAKEDSTLLFGYGTPFNEPIVARGPFVMNSQAEIQQAMLDYQSGKMGRL